VSVVIPGLQEIDEAVVDAIHNPVLLCDSARPYVRAEVAKRFGFSDPAERIAQRGFHQAERLERDSPICLDPMPKVVQALRLKDRLARQRRPDRLVRPAAMRPAHDSPLSDAERRSQAGELDRPALCPARPSQCRQ
jgi:hypothetical protein